MGRSTNDLQFQDSDAGKVVFDVTAATKPGFKVTLESNRRGLKRCESCTKGGPLHHLVMPKSTYRYPKAEVRYKDYWLCEDCYQKMRAAMDKEDA